MIPIPVWRTTLAFVAVIVAHPGTWIRISWLIVMIYLLYHVAIGFLVLDDATTLIERIRTSMKRRRWLSPWRSKEPANRLTFVNCSR